MRRRTFLTAVASTTTVGLAGCITSEEEPVPPRLSLAEGSEYFSDVFTIPVEGLLSNGVTANYLGVELAPERPQQPSHIVLRHNGGRNQFATLEDTAITVEIEQEANSLLKNRDDDWTLVATAGGRTTRLFADYVHGRDLESVPLQIEPGEEVTA